MTETDPFVSHRALLFTVAYQMLGSAADAEDVVQETWLRWTRVDQAQVSEPRAYLVRITTRLALDRMRALSRRREDYVGEWLPEPLLTTPDVAEDVELAESVSMAMLTVLESLAPTDRAVFVLREVFDMPYEEIAQAVGKSATAVRQIAYRARARVAKQRPRVRVSVLEERKVVEQLLHALRTGEVQVLMDLLAPDVVLVADGGGVAAAALTPIIGLAQVVQMLTGVDRSQHEMSVVWLNGGPAIRIGANEAAAVLALDLDHGRINRIYATANPEKLTRLTEPVPLTR